MTSDDIVCISFLYLLLLLSRAPGLYILESLPLPTTNNINSHASFDLSIFTPHATLLPLFSIILFVLPFSSSIFLYLTSFYFSFPFSTFSPLWFHFFYSNDYEVHAPLSNLPRNFQYTNEHVFLGYLSSSSPSLPSLSRILLMLFLITSVTSSTWRLWVSYYIGYRRGALFCPYFMPPR
jgi:hypothetical protein